MRNTLKTKGNIFVLQQELFGFLVTELFGTAIFILISLGIAVPSVIPKPAGKIH